MSSGGKNDNNNSSSSSGGGGSKDQTNWDPFLRHSSALGILKPNIVFDVFNMAQQLPHPRLLRTSHDGEGSSVFASDDLVAPFFPFGPRGPAFTLLDTRPAVPVSNGGGGAAAGPPPPSESLPRCPPAGVCFCISDFPPNHSAPMHRTLSLDYAVVLAGEIALRLDGGDEKTLRAGEFLIQGGANHEWVNRSTDPCRILFVMVAADKITLADGGELDETLPK